ncbi:hypothetical protein HPB50_000025 [Hyalomma asiaticum]|uniref:Uncharacterized protein n=1 Tax=Hyalomma asiaticum TaxID=266040 RepID=A0ACB7RI50_HYAAI|nr:hypothetical protein HPB50_000025 [Hyalomma asiaticum]
MTGVPSAAELRGEPRVVAFSGDLSLDAVDFADAGEYICSARYADGEALTEPRESRHILQVACSPGQYGKSDACHFCPVGSFSERHGALCCQRCPFLYVTWGRGATSRQECSGVLHDFLIGLAVMACLSLNLYALVKFSGPIVLDSLSEYVFREATASKSEPGADVCDDEASDDGGMPENLFDGISKLAARLKKRKFAKFAREEDVPLLPASRSSAAGPEDSSEDDEGGQSVICYNDDDDASLDSADDASRRAPIQSPQHPKRPIVIRSSSTSGGDVDPEQPASERDVSSPGETSSGSTSDVALAGSPDEDWFSSGRRRWIGRYDVTAVRTSEYDATPDGRRSELSGGTSWLPEQRATYDVFVGRWSSSDTADATCNDTFLLSDGCRSAPAGSNVNGNFECSSGSSSKWFEDSQFHQRPLKRPLQSSGNAFTKALSSPDDVTSSTPTWEFSSGPHETISARKPARYDHELASERYANTGTHADAKSITGRWGDSGKIDNRDCQAEAVVWADDVSSENSESGETRKAVGRDANVASLETHSSRRLHHGDGERIGDVSEPAESGYSMLASSVTNSSAETAGRTAGEHEVEFVEPGRRATRASIEASAPWMKRRYSNDADA